MIRYFDLLALLLFLYLKNKISTMCIPNQSMSFNDDVIATVKRNNSRTLIWSINKSNLLISNKSLYKNLSNGEKGKREEK